MRLSYILLGLLAAAASASASVMHIDLASGAGAVFLNAPDAIVYRPAAGVAPPWSTLAAWDRDFEGKTVAHDAGIWSDDGSRVVPPSVACISQPRPRFQPVTNFDSWTGVVLPPARDPYLPGPEHSRRYIVIEPPVLLPVDHPDYLGPDLQVTPTATPAPEPKGYVFILPVIFGFWLASRGRR